MSMRCEAWGCVAEAGAPLRVRQEDDWTMVSVSLCAEHKTGVDSGALRVNRRTAQGCFELIPGPGIAPRQGVSPSATLPQRR
jgi:hypothetical protein